MNLFTYIGTSLCLFFHVLRADNLFPPNSEVTTAMTGNEVLENMRKGNILVANLNEFRFEWEPENAWINTIFLDGETVSIKDNPHGRGDDMAQTKLKYIQKCAHANPRSLPSIACRARQKEVISRRSVFCFVLSASKAWPFYQLISSLVCAIYL